MTTAMRAADRQAAFESFLAEQREQDLLRFITCGSVDDGKSTLIGRLLWDAQQLYDDQLAALSAESKRYGTQGDDIDFALLVDGLAAERVGCPASAGHLSGRAAARARGRRKVRCEAFSDEEIHNTVHT